MRRPDLRKTIALKFASTHLAKANQMLSTNDHATALHYAKRAADSFAKWSPQSSNLARSLTRAAIAQQRLGQLESARRDIDEAVTNFRQLRLPAGLSAALTVQAGLQRLSGDLDGAMTGFREAFRLARSPMWDENDGARVLIEATAQEGIGSVHLSRGEPVQALSYFHKALIDYEKDPRGLTGAALVLSDIGKAHLAMHQPEQALQFFEQCLETSEASANPLGAVNALVGIGSVHKQSGRLEPALSFFDQAQDIIEKLRTDSLLAARVQRLIGETSLDMDNREKARNATGQALAVASRIAPRSMEMARCLLAVGRVALAFGELLQATESFKQALAVAQTAALTSDETLEALKDLSNTLALMGDLTSAASYGSRAASIEALRATPPRTPDN